MTIVARLPDPRHIGRCPPRWRVSCDVCLSVRVVSQYPGHLRRDEARTGNRCLSCAVKARFPGGGRGPREVTCPGCGEPRIAKCTAYQFRTRSHRCVACGQVQRHIRERRERESGAQMVAGVMGEDAFCRALDAVI